MDYMKKVLTVLFCLVLSAGLFAQEFKLEKILEIKNSQNEKELLTRPDEAVAPYDDDSKNIMKFSPDGRLFIHDVDMNKIITIDLNSNKVDFVGETNFLEIYKCEFLTSVGDEYLLFTGRSGRFVIVDKKLKLKAKIKISDWGNMIDNIPSETFFSEEVGILFFRDINENLYSIVNPGLDNEKNKENFKSSQETLDLFSSGIDMKNLGLFNNKYLTIDGKSYYWDGLTINKINYQIMPSLDRVNIWLSNNRIRIDTKDTEGIEVVESIAIHPSGDIYILRMNWNTNTHNLYRVENTWDSDWRVKWYKSRK